MNVKEYTYGNAIIIVHRPTLDDKERSRREHHIETALQQFGKEMYKEDKNVH